MRIVIADFTLDPRYPGGEDAAERNAITYVKDHPFIVTGADDESVVRMYAEMTDEGFESFTSEWNLGSETPEPNLGALTPWGHVTGDTYIMDGVDWNVGGVTPFLDVSLFVSDDLLP